MPHKDKFASPYGRPLPEKVEHLKVVRPPPPVYSASLDDLAGYSVMIWYGEFLRSTDPRERTKMTLHAMTQQMIDRGARLRRAESQRTHIDRTYGESW